VEAAGTGNDEREVERRGPTRSSMAASRSRVRAAAMDAKAAAGWKEKQRAGVGRV
jgi:hypothetical protein